ncbi:UNVERIFIED_CONTAM: hypothetical protein HDU68_006622 [Siphonaria sp. JEL0065]|nr:hypothetical protein HDU68_006622 [Siphonaria sp. JEL0065]
MFATQAYQPARYHAPTVDCDRRQSIYAAPSSPQVPSMASPAISSLSTFSTFSTVSTSSSMIGAGGINLLLDSPELSPVAPLFTIPELALPESHTPGKQQPYAPDPVSNYNTGLPSIRSTAPFSIPTQSFVYNHHRHESTATQSLSPSVSPTMVQNSRKQTVLLSSVLPLSNPTTMNTQTQDPTAALTALPNLRDATIS